MEVNIPWIPMDLSWEEKNFTTTSMDKRWASEMCKKPGHRIIGLGKSLSFRTSPTWLVVSTPLKKISQIGSFPQVGVKIKKYLKPPPSNQVPGNSSGFCPTKSPEMRVNLQLTESPVRSHLKNHVATCLECTERVYWFIGILMTVYYNPYIIG